MTTKDAQSMTRLVADLVVGLDPDTAPKLYELIRNGDEEEYNFHDETVGRRD